MRGLSDQVHTALMDDMKLFDEEMPSIGFFCYKVRNLKFINLQTQSQELMILDTQEQMVRESLTRAFEELHAGKVRHDARKLFKHHTSSEYANK